jgi:hypothetical protein
MSSLLRRAAFALPVLLALALSGQARGDVNLFLGNPIAP